MTSRLKSIIGSKILFLATLGLGLIFEILSFLMFQGLWANETNWVCGSACEIWPGIMTSEICILMCVERNGNFVLFLWLGVGFLALGVFNSLLRRKLLGNKKKSLQK